MQHRFITVFGCLALVLSVGSSYAVSPKARQQFIKFMAPKIERVNRRIIKTRSHVVQLHAAWEERHVLAGKQSYWLQKMAKLYRVKNDTFTTENGWHKLIVKVDGLPVSLVLAQAINESAWGRSYFAKKANNYFGIWCTAPGCGIIPRRRPAGATYEVRTFSNAESSVSGYLLNINRQRSYRGLRALRAKQRKYGRGLSGYMLAEGLRHYSQLGVKYVGRIKAIMRKYDLESYN